jgi:hypothetical protein
MKTYVPVHPGSKMPDWNKTYSGILKFSNAKDGRNICISMAVKLYGEAIGGA